MEAIYENFNVVNVFLSLTTYILLFMVLRQLFILFFAEKQHGKIVLYLFLYTIIPVGIILFLPNTLINPVKLVLQLAAPLILLVILAFFIVPSVNPRDHMNT